MHASISTPSAQVAVGAVLVVGGGVAGVQAALDLTELGLKVYLVEKKRRHRRGHGPAGQDLSHQRLLALYPGAQAG